ncbi:M1 family metallopeptidase [Cystobacter fuscus]|uniref:M1 family metallopeptidase n=1 Tax=Cystobacter fuscus TaxID=43 RepID=UPI0005B7CD1E|nr:M1 family metallopeptidase [Cystobacter fuscus]
MLRTFRRAALVLSAALTACATRLEVSAAPASASAPGAAPAAPRSPPVSPTLRLPTGVRPTGYSAELTLDPTQPTFQGVLDIDLDVKETTRTVWLLGHELTVKEASLTVGGVPVAVSQVKGTGDFLGFQPEAALGPGPAHLRLVYEGVLSEREVSGAFRALEAGDWYAFTQFEPLGARRVFPCFDEPGFKVPWQLTFHVPAGLTVVTNTPVVSQEPGGEGGTTWRFARTQPLPSYLVAFGVGPFDFLEAPASGEKAVRTRIVTTRGRAAEGAHAARVTPGLLAWLERYFGVPYPYEKLDVLAVPLFQGAMENPGLVTFNSELMLAREEEDSVERQRSFYETQAHELAHQWFGNLVTMQWWDDLWLNEAFASWAASRAVADTQPSWDEPLTRVGARSRTLTADSLLSARRIRQPIQGEDDIFNAFDGITYGKGAAVLYMTEQWLGPDVFQRGARRHLRAHEHGSATASDFIAALSAEAQRDVSGVLDSFLEQGGAPLITARLDCSARVPEVELTQRRFLPLGSAGGTQQLWKVPVCVRHGTGARAARACTLLETETARLPLPEARGCPAWLEPNADGAGYYRTSVDARMLSRLLSTDSRHLSRAERVALLGDMRALVGAGAMPAADALGLLPGLAGEKDLRVFQSSLELLELMKPSLLSEPRQADRQRFLRDTYGARARALGFTPRATEDVDTRLLRPLLLELAGKQGGDPRLTAEARRLTERWLGGDTRAIDAELVESTLATAAAWGDAALHARMMTALSAATERKRREEILGALRDFHQADLVQRNLGLLLEPAVDLREVWRLLFGAASDVRSRDVASAFVSKNYDALAARMPDEQVAYLAAVASSYCDPVHRQETAAFFTERMTRAAGGPRSLALVLESIDLCIAFKAAQGPSIESFLAAPRRAR